MCNFVFESLITSLTRKWLSVQYFGRQSEHSKLQGLHSTLNSATPCTMPYWLCFCLQPCPELSVTPCHVLCTGHMRSCQSDRLLASPVFADCVVPHVKATDSSSHLSLQIVLRKLSGADPEGRRHCIKLLRTFDYRGHLCMAFEAMVCLSAACAMLTPLKLCPVKPSREAL